MRVDDALRQIEAIHEQLDKSETYRGFQVGGVAAAGVVGLVAAALQERIVRPEYFIAYWIGVAAVCGVLAAGSALFNFFRVEDSIARRKTSRMLTQFVPSLFVGAVVTWVFVRTDLTAYLPGMWAMLFGLGILSARPYLPRAIGWVSLFYLVCGCGLLLWTHSRDLGGWQVGGVFGVGHLAAAFVLSRNVERGEV